MQYRRFGRTELNLSVFSLGTMRCLASPAVFGATLQQGLDLGINHIETARGYGTSERWLGDWLRHHGRPAGLVLTTKIPPQPNRATMAAHLEESLARLGVDYIDCLAIHGLNTEEHLNWVRDPQGCMAAVWQAQAEGKVGHVGFRPTARGRSLKLRSPPATLALSICTTTTFFSAMPPLLTWSSSRIWGCLSSHREIRAGCCTSPLRR